MKNTARGESKAYLKEFRRTRGYKRRLRGWEIYDRQEKKAKNENEKEEQTSNLEGNKDKEK